jgi:hypothetical protein
MRELFSVSSRVLGESKVGFGACSLMFGCFMRISGALTCGGVHGFEIRNLCRVFEHLNIY